MTVVALIAMAKTIQICRGWTFYENPWCSSAGTSFKLHKRIYSSQLSPEGEDEADSHSHQLQASMKEWPRGSGTHNHTSSRPLFRGGPEAAALILTPASCLYLREAQRQRHSHSHQLAGILSREGPEAAALTLTPAPGLYLGEAQRQRHSHSHQLQASI